MASFARCDQLPEGNGVLLALGAETLTVYTTDGIAPPAGEAGTPDGGAFQIDGSAAEGGS